METIPFVETSLIQFLGADDIFEHHRQATPEQIANLKEHCIWMYIARLNMNWTGGL